MGKITKRTVDAAVESSSRAYLWDDKLAGFGLVVQPSGTKSYVFQYRTAEGQTRRITIGVHGSPYTPESARAKAKKYADAVEAGADPLAEKRARRGALTVADLLDRYLKSPTFAEKAASTRAIDSGRIARHLRPLLGRKIADKLTPDDVRQALADITDGKTAASIKTGPRGRARVTGGAGAARMAIRLLKAIYVWALEAEIVKVNPAAAVKVGKDGTRETVIDAQEYATLFAAIQSIEERRELRPAAADAIRVIALTGARRNEIASLRWRHVDLSKGLIVLSAGEHKTGRKTSAPRVIGLPAVAQAIIAKQPQGKPDDYVFTPARGKGAISLAKPWRTIRKAAGLSGELGLHGLRHSLATSMALSGAQAAQIMTVMGHRNITTAQRYVHIAQDLRAEMAEQAAAGISAAFTGAKAAEVVPAKRSRVGRD